MTEICYLKRYGYFPNCSVCLGEDNNPCYHNQTDVAEHVQHLHRLFAERLETDVEDDPENMFVLDRKGGFI